MLVNPGIRYTLCSMSSPALSPEELTALVARAQNGDTEAFGRIYDVFLTPIYRYIVFRFPEDLAEDLVADVFVKAWEKLSSYRPFAGVPFSAWLFRIARYTLIDAYRSERGFEELSEDLVDENRENNPQLYAERKLSVKVVRRALLGLPKDYRDVLLLHYVAGLGHSEVAKALKMTEGYVRQLKFRGLKKLETLLPSAEKAS
jgi:RNA polymerase sigma-70 factor (ECF subfamily)